MSTNDTINRSLLLLGVVVVLAITGAVLLGPVAAQSTSDNATTTGNTTSTANETMAANNTTNATLVADPSTEGATANHTLNLTLDDTTAKNLTSIQVNYTGTNTSIGRAPNNFRNATLAGESITGNITPSAQLAGQALLNISFEFNATPQPHAGDRLSFMYQKVVNPSEPDTYPVGITVNAGNNTTNMTANMNITENQTTAQPTTGATTTAGATTTTEATTTEATTETTTTAGATTTGATTTAGATTEATTTAEATTTSGNGPGFTVFVAILGAIAAALLAVRRT